jgi:hypothetical protein
MNDGLNTPQAIIERLAQLRDLLKVTTDQRALAVIEETIQELEARLNELQEPES